MSLSNKDSFFANTTRTNNNSNSFQKSPLVNFDANSDNEKVQEDESNIRREIENKYAQHAEEYKRKLKLEAEESLSLEKARIENEAKKKEIDLKSRIEKEKAELEDKIRQLENGEKSENKGSQLQKFRKYPERKFDKLISKILYIEPETLQMCRDIAVEISLARKTLDLDKNNPLPRFSENTVIRAAVKAILHSEKIANVDLRTIQTEDSLEEFFRGLLN